MLGGVFMFTARFETNDSTRNNICGLSIKKLRKSLRWSQRILAERLEDCNLFIDKNAVQRIESGQRFLTDIEMIAFAKVFNVTITDLYGPHI